MTYKYNKNKRKNIFLKKKIHPKAKAFGFLFLSLVNCHK